MSEHRSKGPPGGYMNMNTTADLEPTLSAIRDAIRCRDFGSAVMFLDSYYVGRLAGCAEPQPIGDERAGRLARRLREALLSALGESNHLDQ